MRKVIFEAEVGDEQKGEDPSVNRLTAAVAERLGQEVGLFLPSGTMCNAVAIKTHTQPGEAVLADRDSHIIRFETGGPALISGVLVEMLPSERGLFQPADVTRAVPAPSHYAPRATLLSIEQTHNLGGGTVWPLAQLEAVITEARRLGLSIHLDGARLFNASVASGLDPIRFGRLCDSVWVDFTKGLGCPLGAVLVGSREFIQKARRYKHLLGGALRQAGMMAAAGLFALEHHVERLAEDHQMAARLAQGMTEAGIEVEPVETNLVFFRKPSETFVADLRDEGVRVDGVGDRLRAATHLDVTPDDIETALQAIHLVLERQSVAT